MTLRNWGSKAWLLGGVVAVLSVGCSSAGDDPARRDVGKNVPNSSGQTGSIAPSQCRDDSDCLPFGEQLLEEFRMPRVLPGLTGASCSKVGTASVDRAGAPPPWDEIACVCAYEDGSSYWIGTGQATSCPLNRLGGCLYEYSEFPGCEAATESASCQAVCEEVQTRRQADAARALSATVREARCTPAGSAYSCEYSFAIEGSCYSTLAPRDMAPQDCEQPDPDRAVPPTPPGDDAP